MKDHLQISGKNLNKNCNRYEFKAYKVEQAYSYWQKRCHNTNADQAFTYGGNIGGVNY